MKRGSTTPITITIDGIDLTGAEWLIVSVKRAARPNLELSGDRLSVSYSEGATASQAYAAGDAFLHAGALYKATASIAQGDAIVPGTNCSRTTIIDLMRGV